MKIELLKPHTHAGTLYRPGDKIEVDTDVAQWLLDNGVAAPVASAKKPKPLTTTEQ